LSRQPDATLLPRRPRDARSRAQQPGQGVAGVRVRRAASGRHAARVLPVGTRRRSMAAISRLGYLGFEVSDVAAWGRFAVDALGLLVSERRSDGSVAFRIDEQAQRIVVHPGSRDDLAYAGFEVDDEATLRRLSEALNQAGFPTADPGDDVARARRVQRVLRVEDPNGVPIELFYG